MEISYRDQPKSFSEIIEKDTQELEANRRKFIKNSYTAKKVKKEFILEDEDLKRIGATEAFGRVRYLHSDIIGYLKYEK